MLLLRFEDLAACTRSSSAPGRDPGRSGGLVTDLAHGVPAPAPADLAPVRLGPLTVVADALLRHLRRGGALPLSSPDVTYLYGQQLREADLLLLNKIDLLPGAETVELAAFLQARTLGVPVLPVSASTGQGLEAWTGGLEAALDGPQPDPGGGGREGAQTGWPGAGPPRARACSTWTTTATRTPRRPWGGSTPRGRMGTSPAGDQDYGETWAHAALSGLAALAREAGAEVVHAKLRLDAAGSSCVANLVQNAGAPFVRCAGRLAGPAALVLNARVAHAPALVRAWTGPCRSRRPGHHRDHPAGGALLRARPSCAHLPPQPAQRSAPTAVGELLPPGRPFHLPLPSRDALAAGGTETRHLPKPGGGPVRVEVAPGARPGGSRRPAPGRSGARTRTRPTGCAAAPSWRARRPRTMASPSSGPLVDRSAPPPGTRSPSRPRPRRGRGTPGAAPGPGASSSPASSFSA